MMAGSSLLTTWLGIANGIDRLPLDAGIKFSNGDDITTIAGIHSGNCNIFVKLRLIEL
jgi:hypothetical protein